MANVPMYTVGEILTKRYQEGDEHRAYMAKNIMILQKYETFGPSRPKEHVYKVLDLDTGKVDTTMAWRVDFYYDRPE